MAGFHSEELPAQSKAAIKSSGFTLVEILVVIVIIATLTSIAYPFYTSYIDKAKIALGISTLETVRKTIENYAIDKNGYPPAIDLATGEDGQGRVVLPPALLDECKQHLFSLESYVSAANDYTLTARAIDTNHSTLVLTPGQVISQGP